MKITKDNWLQLAATIKAKILSQYDSGTLVPKYNELSYKFKMPHNGFYISVYDSNNQQLARTGFLKENCENIIDSADKVLNGLVEELNVKKIQYKKLLTSSYNFVIVWDVVFIENALNWDANEDGIYMTWGDKYKGMYLPYDIKIMSTTKVEALNRLCSWQIKIPSNLWKLPEGMVYKILCDSYGI